MLDLSTFLVIYVLGGITFIPLLLVAGFAYAYFTLPVPNQTDRADRELSNGHIKDSAASELQSLPDELKPRAHDPDVAAGYFAVCREYVPGGINGKPPERTTPAGAIVAPESPSVYQSMYRSIFDRNKTSTPTLDGANGKAKRARNVFYVVLRHGHLMLYDDSEQLEVRHVVSLAPYEVDIYAGGEKIPEGELWIKRHCIRLHPKSSLGESEATAKPLYIFSDNCSEKEDFYFAMLQNQERKPNSSENPPSPLLFDTPHLVKLVQQLHASEENIQTRWVNALVGRLFLALYKTPEVEDFIRMKITKKIARVPKPAFITGIKLQRIDMGDLPPFITNPKMRELSVDGALTVEADVKYKGNIRIELSAIARVDLGPRFKAREVTLVLATTLKKLEGHLLIKIKPPPSNRLWISFETPPKMDISLEPIVSSRQITYGVILRALESRIREVFNETLVSPFWDDLPFTDTIKHRFRGGVWADDRRTFKAEETVIESGKDTPTTVTDQTEEQEGLDSSSADSGNSAGSGLDAEKTRSMPNLTRMPASPVTPRKSTASSIASESKADKAEFTSGSEVRQPEKPPRVIRSTSFASAASPVVQMSSANVEPMKSPTRTSQPDAATAMKTISDSQPSSPVGSLSGSPGRTRAKSYLDGKGEDVTSLFSKMEIPRSETAPSRTSTPSSSVSSSHGGAEAPEAGLKTKPTSLSLPRNAFGPSSEKRQTLNQSLNTATAAAKKWFASRQNNNSNNDTQSHTTTDSLDTKHQTNTSSTKLVSDGKLNPSLPLPEPTSANPSPLGSPAYPIGRGQPLPPPGTPLPPPPKPEKKTGWGAAGASALVNLAKRKPFGVGGGGGGTQNQNQNQNQKGSTVQMEMGNKSEENVAAGGKNKEGEHHSPPKSNIRPTTATGVGRRSSSISGSGVLNPGSNTNRRRQRLSVGENVARGMGMMGMGNPRDEGLLVVEAPVVPDLGGPGLASVPKEEEEEVEREVEAEVREREEKEHEGDGGEEEEEAFREWGIGAEDEDETEEEHGDVFGGGGMEMESADIHT